MPPRTWHSRASVAAAVTAASLLLAPMMVRADQPATTIHVVQAGETLWQIADNAGVDSTALATLNGLDDPNLLSVGQSLKVPGRTAPPGAASAAPASPPSAPPTVKTYVVADGDTLWAIAEQ